MDKDEIKKLSYKEIFVLKKRFLDNYSLSEIAGLMNMSYEGVRLIYLKMLGKLKKYYKMFRKEEYKILSRALLDEINEKEL